MLTRGPALCSLMKISLFIQLLFSCQTALSYMMTLDDMPQDEQVLEFVAGYLPEEAYTARRSFRNQLNAAAHIMLAGALDRYQGNLSSPMLRYRRTVAHLLELRLNRPELQRYFRPVPAEMDQDVARVLANNHEYLRHPAPAEPAPVQAQGGPALPKSCYKIAELEKEETCAICQEDSKTLSELKTCSHRFHLECIGSWYKIKNTCPLCRGKISG